MPPTKQGDAALDDDLNTPVALAALGEMTRIGNETAMLAQKRKKDAGFVGCRGRVRPPRRDAIKALTQQLGLMNVTPAVYAARVKERRLALRKLSAARHRAEARRARRSPQSQRLRAQRRHPRRAARPGRRHLRHRRRLQQLDHHAVASWAATHAASLAEAARRSGAPGRPRASSREMAEQGELGAAARARWLERATTLCAKPRSRSAIERRPRITDLGEAERAAARSGRRGYAAADQAKCGGATKTCRDELGEAERHPGREVGVRLARVHRRAATPLRSDVVRRARRAEANQNPACGSARPSARCPSARRTQGRPSEVRRRTKTPQQLGEAERPLPLRSRVRRADQAKCGGEPKPRNNSARPSARSASGHQDRLRSMQSAEET